MSGGKTDTKTEELCDVTLTFWEVAINTILYARGVYPPEIFERRKAYGIGVFMSRVPQLNDSIHECLHHAKPHLLAGSIEGMVLVLLDGSEKAIEQYVFDVDVQSEDIPATYSDLETMFSSAIIRLGALQSLSRPLPDDVSFTILLKTHEFLTGPNDKTSHDASGVKDAFIPSVLTTDGARVPPTEPGRLGVPGDRGLSYWIRSDRGDPETTLLDETTGKHAPIRPIKSLHAGPLIMNISMMLPA